MAEIDDWQAEDALSISIEQATLQGDGPRCHSATPAPRSGRKQQGVSDMHARHMLAAVVTSWVAAIGVLLLSGTRTVTAAQAPTQGEGYYTEAQATRGEMQFNRYCAMCHTVDGSTTAEQLRTGRGLRVGSSRALMNLGGSYLKTSFEGHPDYPSVYYLFNRIREAMPGFGADTVGIDAKVDIVAYLLNANGLPPGPRELTAEVGVMKRMPINPVPAPDETGFEPLFNGRDFTGFKFLLGPNCKPAPEGCGKTDPGSVFRVEGGKIICTGKTQGYMVHGTEVPELHAALRLPLRAASGLGLRGRCRVLWQQRVLPLHQRPSGLA